MPVGGKVKQGITDYFGPKYDSDKDLTPEERKRIRMSANPDAVRKNIWDNKDTGSKLMKMVQSGWSGDKRNRE